MAAAWAHGDPSVVVAGVLRDPAYAALRPTTAREPAKTVLEAIWDWIWVHVIAPLVHPLAHALGASRDAGTAVGFVLIAFALAGLAFVVVRLLVAFVRPLPSGLDATRPVPATLAQRPTREWRALARAAAERGDYAEAIAALFAAALAELDERAVVAFDAARTPGEYRRLVRRARAAAEPPFDDLAERFVHAAYGPDAAAATDYDAAERAFAAFEPALIA